MATALDNVVSGEIIEILEREGSNFELEVVESIPFGHKVAVEVINPGQEVTKYGVSIGLSTEQIGKGKHVHTHNLVSKKGKAKDGTDEQQS